MRNIRFFLFFECVCATVVTNLLVAFCGMSVCLFVCLPALSVCLPYYIFASLSLYVFVVRCLFSNCLFDCFLHLILHYFYCWTTAVLISAVGKWKKLAKNCLKNWLKTQYEQGVSSIFRMSCLSLLSDFVYPCKVVLCVCVCFFTFTLLVKKCNKCFLMDSGRQPTHPAGMAVGQKFNFNLFTL